MSTNHRYELDETALRAAIDAYAAIGDAPLTAAPARAGRPPALNILPAGRPLGEVLAHLRDKVFARAARSDHRRFFAFVPAPVSPLSRLGDVLTALHNPHAGGWEQAAGPCAIERATIAFLADAADLPATAGGLFVSGGSIANLTALTVARDQKLGEDERGSGVAYVSAQTHVSVMRALRIIGLLERQIRVVAVDDRFRMDLNALAQAVAADRAAGLKPFVVAATAGTTDTGAVDPLGPIADLCAREEMWLHVDGAYGASVLLSEPHRALVAGIERADSLAWDAHKWLFQTYGCGVALLRDGRLLRDSFRLGADYLGDGCDAEPNFWDLGPELTRPARATKLWLTLQVMGLDAVGAAIGHGVAMAEAAERAVRATPDWTVASPAALAIVCFRYAPSGLSDVEADAINSAAARRLVADGFAVVGTTRLLGRIVLRICAIHPLTIEADMVETVRRLDVFARDEAGATSHP